MASPAQQGPSIGAIMSSMGHNQPGSIGDGDGEFAVSKKIWEALDEGATPFKALTFGLSSVTKASLAEGGLKLENVALVGRLTPGAAIGMGEGPAGIMSAKKIKVKKSDRPMGSARG